MTIRLVPNPGETHASLRAKIHGHTAPNTVGQPVGPAHLPGSPPFAMPPQGWSGPNPSYASGPVGPAGPVSMKGVPIYPAPGWHVGPSVAYLGGYAGDYGDPSQSEFAKMFKFGVVDNGILVIATLLGGKFDPWIADKLGTPRGWGPVMGATVGNAVSDLAAGWTDGTKPALGVFVGCLLPIIPVFVASSLMKKKPEDATTRNVLIGLSGAMVLGAYLKK